jgi:hypothetical protein
LGLARKFRDALITFHDIQSSYREKQKSRFERQYLIVNPTATQEEIDRVLDEHYSGPIFAQTVSMKYGIKDVKLCYNKLQYNIQRVNIHVASNSYL